MFARLAFSNVCRLSRTYSTGSVRCARQLLVICSVGISLVSITSASAAGKRSMSEVWPRTRRWRVIRNRRNRSFTPSNSNSSKALFLIRWIVLSVRMAFKSLIVVVQLRSFGFYFFTWSFPLRSMETRCETNSSEIVRRDVQLADRNRSFFDFQSNRFSSWSQLVS